MDQRMRKRIILVNFIFSCEIAAFHFANAALEPVSSLDSLISDFITDGFALFSYFAMGWFFMLTGFLLFRNYTPAQYGQKIKRRFVTVFVCYLLWQLAFGLKGFLAGETSIRQLISTVFLMKVDPPDGPLWYMSAIFYLALLSPLFYPLVKNKKLGILTILVVLAGSYFMYTTKMRPYSKVGQYGRVKDVFLYLGAYFTGLYLGLHHADSDRKDILPLLFIMLTFGFVVDLIWDGFLVFTTKKLVPVLLLYTFPVIENERFCKYASGSFLIYALHAATKWGRITRIRRIFLLPICRSAWFLNLFCRLGALVFTMGVAAVLWVLASLFCPKILDLFTGGRVKPVTKPVWDRFRKENEDTVRPG